MDPLGQLGMIYQKFDLGDFNTAKIPFADYLETQKNYKIDSYQIKRDELDQVLERLDFAMKFWNYSIPENIEVL